MKDTNFRRKAAILLTVLPQEVAGKLLSYLEPRQIELVSIEIAQLGVVTSREQLKVVNEFVDVDIESVGSASGDLDLAKMLVAHALGDRAQPTIDNVCQSVESVPFGFLRDVDPEHVRAFISEEHPQTIALIMSFLPSKYGAQIIGELSLEKQLEVVRRIANMGQTSPEVIADIENGLRSRLASFMNQSFDSVGGVGSVAKILNVTDRATERSLLESLNEQDAELVEEIRRLMFVFEDITKLTDKEIQILLKNIDQSLWATALKGSSQALKDKIFKNMSQRATQMLEEEMQYLGAIKLSEVEAVQRQIVDTVRGLEESGEISSSAGEDEEFVS
jgi:flagellar motor switch protein FliG